MSKPIIYQMLPRLWGEGRMSSVDDATLDCLRGFGVSHVWCTGIIRHSTSKPFVKGDAGSPYAISDYYDVNPYLADVPSRRMSEFRSLVRRVHSHGLKLIIDFVPNHVGCDYSDKHGGIPLCGWHDYDWSDTVKIDYSAPGTWEAMYGIVRFWASKGVDGFRCDMVELVPPEFLKWLIARIKEEFPSVIFVAEVYQKEKYRMYIEDVRFDYLYDKSGLYDVLRAIVAGHGTARAITWNWQFLQDLQPRMLNFLENHDEQRLASPWFAGRPDLYSALCASLMLNTAPFMLYFGQETGVNASEGHEGRTSIFNFDKPDSLQRLYAYVHGKALPEGEAAVMARYRDALQLAASPSVSEGLTYDLCYCQSPDDGFDADRHFVFLRHADAETMLFCCNFSDSEARVTVRIPDHAVEYLGLGSKPSPDGISLTVNPFDYTVAIL